MAEMCGNIRYDYSPGQYVTCARGWGVLSVVQLTVWPTPSATVAVAVTIQTSAQDPQKCTRREDTARRRIWSKNWWNIRYARERTQSFSERCVGRWPNGAISKFVCQLNPILSGRLCAYIRQWARFARKAQMLDGQYHRFGRVCVYALVYTVRSNLRWCCPGNERKEHLRILLFGSAITITINVF